MPKTAIDEALLTIQELIDYCKKIDDESAWDGYNYDTWQSDEFSELIAKAEGALQSIKEDDVESTG